MSGPSEERRCREVKGVGVDMVTIARLEQAVTRWGERFTTRVFTKGEMEYSRRRARTYQHLSARFAGKEAVVKAIGTGFRRGCRMQEIEISADGYGRPLVTLRGAAGRLAAERGIEEIFLSLSHTETAAVAQAVAVGKARYEEDNDAVS